MNKWSKQTECCKKCGTTEIKHKGYGLCRVCYTRSEYHHASTNKYKSSLKGRKCSREYEQYLRHKALDYYSGGTMKCKNCGYNDIRALALDHINNDGSKQRKSMNTTIFAWLRTNKYPIGYQVLCMNCNWIKEHERRKATYEKH